jgi:N-acetylglucosamine-6-phosphate deacetylase
MKAIVDASAEPTSTRPDLVLTGRSAEDGRAVRLTVRDGRIASIERDDVATGDVWVSAGWTDSQINGYGGHDPNAAGADGAVVSAMVRALWPEGVTGSCVTICTESAPRMLEGIRSIAEACEQDPLAAASIVGIHVEGPHLAREDGPRGAHPLRHIRPPDIDEYRRWQDAAGGRIRIVTVAPEYDEVIPYIRAVVADGVLVSIGHTAASGDQIRAAVDAGARWSTHLGNGAHAVIRRHPNYIWDQLAEDRLTASFIADGIHVPPAFLKAAIRAKQIGRSVLVTDASTPAGSPPGRYQLGAQELELTADGRVVLAGQDRLAGSALRMDDAVANAIRFAGVSLPDAVTMATTNAARAGRVPGRHIGLAGGERADFVRFHFDPSTGEVRIQETYLSGRCVFHRSHAAVVGSFA